ncbi:MAG TPA: PstS family phosphate ABC transporter substrate-binding protein [Dehalococcoidia bacterium]
MTTSAQGRHSTRFSALAVVLPLALVALAAIACDDSGTGGKIDIDGSSTVYPITAAVAEDFDAVAGDVLVNVGFSGTGGGFEVFCAGETHVSNASRPVKQDELDACAEKGIDDVLEIQVGLDALTVMVHPDNDFADCLTIEQLHEIFRTDGAGGWSEVDAGFPDRSIALYYPGTDSGTFDYFLEAIIKDVDEAANHRGDGTASEDDNVLAQGIGGDRDSIGYFGFAYFQDAGQSLKAVSVDAGEGCVAPSFDSALDGTYPLSRPLYIYTRESLLAEHPENPVLRFLEFYLDNATALVAEVGYVSLPADTLQAQKDKIGPYLP